MTPDQYCQERAAQSGSSFYYSFLFLEPSRRQAITALYAFCREVDDVVDECPDTLLARAKLAWWRGEVQALFDDRASHPVTQALAASLKSFSLPQEQLLEIIDGMEMDLDHLRYADFKALHLYCYRVASVVGLLAAEIFGYRDRMTLRYAHDLGLAFQLTNIIRDVGEDARRGRIYLPQDELSRFGVDETDLLQARYSDSFRRLMGSRSSAPGRRRNALRLGAARRRRDWPSSAPVTQDWPPPSSSPPRAGRWRCSRRHESSAVAPAPRRSQASPSITDSTSWLARIPKPCA
ncbi:MAG: presqualene diphosphate synthase HpnD [Sulfuritalea sp.]|nr:presqualene diphosphate synthase HpnD [Sulfuritalea sp.]